MAGAGEAVIVALSGGADSICLLDVMARLQSTWGWKLEVAHVDHGLSEESGNIAARVVRDAADAGFEVHMVRAPDLSGPNLQARARVFRYGFFETIAEQVGATKIATGHTLDDRVETTVARLIHGAGTDGLAGLRPAEGNRIRPLIDIRRRETRSYCEQLGLDFFDDPANADPRFERAFIRASVIGEIETRWGDGAVRAMATSSERLAEDAAGLDSMAETLYRGLVVRGLDQESFQRTALSAMPRALRRRVLERAVGRVRDRSGGIEGALDGLDRPEEAGTKGELVYAVANGIEIRVGPDRVVVERPPPSA
jgi:tRNA(Ile)-lysidine synthase